MKRIFLLFSIFLLALLFSGCLSHYVLEGTCRLQLGNETNSYTIEKFSVVSDSNEIPWIEDKILPGEKSKVIEKDFVGTFRIRVELSGDLPLDTIFTMRFHGGSEFLQFKEVKNELIIKRK